MLKDVSPDVGNSEDARINHEDFQNWISHSESVRAIQEVGVDVVGLIDLADLIFIDGSITFGDFMELVLQLRGSNQATVKDIVDLRKFMLQELDPTSILEEINASLEEM